MQTKPNADEIAYWNDTAGEPWVRFQDALDRAFSPVAHAAIELAAPQPGERVLDIGCGAGTTTRELAGRVGAHGEATGIDVSRPLLAQARARSAGVHNMRFIEADASTFEFEKASADLLFSRFGVMFFDQPVAAFANMRSALAPSGRVAFACWRGLADVPFFSVPAKAILPLIPPQPKADPEAPGPMAFANPDRVRGILTDAGFTGVELEALDVMMPIGDGTRAGALQFLLEIGPASRLINEQEESARPPLIEALRSALAQYETPAGVMLGGGIWLVSARLA